MLLNSRIKIYNNTKSILNTLKYLITESNSNLSFKIDLEKYLSQKVYLVPQARVGIYYILKYLKEKKNIEFVFISPYTNIDVINAIRYASLNIKFIDIDLNTGYPLNLKTKIEHPEKSCLIITHLYSNTKMIEKFIVEMSNIKNLKIIEDTAICFGAKYKEIFLGKIFNFGVYSFGLVKNLTTYFGGAVVSKDKEFENFYNEQIKSNINFPKKIIFNKLIYSIIVKLLFENKFIFNFFTIYLLKIAYKDQNNFLFKTFYHQKFPKIPTKITKNYYYNFPSYLSKIGSKSLINCQNQIDTRFKNALFYYNQLKHIKKIFLPKISFDDKEVNAYLEYPIILEEDNKNLLSFLRKKKIYLRHHWYENNCKFFNFSDEILDNCEKLSKNLICLPCHIDINQSYQEKIIFEIKNYFR